MFETARELAGLLGIEPERLRLEWISSAEGRKFAEVIRGFSERLQVLGPWRGLQDGSGKEEGWKKGAA